MPDALDTLWRFLEEQPQWQESIVVTPMPERGGTVIAMTQSASRAFGQWQVDHGMCGSGAIDDRRRWIAEKTTNLEAGIRPDGH